MSEINLKRMLIALLIVVGSFYILSYFLDKDYDTAISFLSSFIVITLGLYIKKTGQTTFQKVKGLWKVLVILGVLNTLSQAILLA